MFKIIRKSDVILILASNRKHRDSNDLKPSWEYLLAWLVTKPIS